MRFGVVVADPPWSFGDKLTMSDVKRGAASQYDTLATSTLMEPAFCALMDAVTAPTCVLALWVPKSMLDDGMDVVRSWDFNFKTIYTWTKRTQIGAPAFGMGRLFRATGEIALIATRGAVLKALDNRSQRDHIDAPTMKHSAKPEALQDSLDLMFPLAPKLELFARRDRPGWTCVGLQCPSTLGEDVRMSLHRLGGTHETTQRDQGSELHGGGQPSDRNQRSPAVVP